VVDTQYNTPLIYKSLQTLSVVKEEEDKAEEK
jgi:hypothetical protein